MRLTVLDWLRPGQRGMLTALVAVALLSSGVESRQRPLGEQVTIRRDTFGVPHILAETDEAAAFGLGYAQAEDHAEAIGRAYLRGRGDAARHFGADELDNDLAVRRLDNLGESARLFERLDPAFKRVVTAFAAGVARYVARHRDALPPWMPDVTAVDVMASIRAEWVEAAIAPSLARALERKYAAAPGGSMGDSARIALDGPVDEGTAGSNALALAGSRTTTGHPILMANPHLNWSARYWEAHLTVPGRIDFYGSCLVGHPWLRAGFNATLGYVQTNNAPDLLDVYALPLEAPAADRYRFDGRTRTLRRREVAVEVRNGDGTTRTERRTYWDSDAGPIVHRTPTLAFAARHVGLEQLTHFDGFYRLSRARSLRDVMAVMRKGLLLTSNFTYADRDGNILYLWNARLPRRVDAGVTYELDVPGATGQYLWRGFHRSSDLPQLLNPSGGYVQNANNSPWYTSLSNPIDASRFPSYIERRPLALRPQIALEMLEARERFSVDDVVALKFTTRMLLADRVKPALLDAARAVLSPSPDLVRGIELLERWDNRAAPDSLGALVFYQFWDTYAKAVQQPYARSWDEQRPMETPVGLSDPASAVKHLEDAVRWVRTKYGREDVAWGDVFRFRMGSHDLPADGGPGTLGLYRVMTFREQGDGTWVAGRTADRPDLVGGGDAWVLLVHFARQVQAYSVLAYGQTTDPASPHSTDQITLFANHQLRPVWYTQADIKTHTVREYRPD